MNEFSLIKRYFQDRQPLHRPDVLLGIGDDCALLQVPEGQALAISIDTSVAGVHFLHDTPAAAVGYKSLAVSLSDLAAMGAEPAWVTVAATLPEINTDWIKDFSEGLFRLAQQFSVQVVGGDTTRGPLSISTAVHGFVPPQQALRRCGAKPGDIIMVSGMLGDAGVGLEIALGKRQLAGSGRDYFLQRLNYPIPRINLGLLLRDYASAAIDLSDGLAGDLGHILNQSRTGALLNLPALPYSSAMLNHIRVAEAENFALHAGDDYELCFTVPPAQLPALLAAAKHLNCLMTPIGVIEAELGLRGKTADGKTCTLSTEGYQHFL